VRLPPFPSCGGPSSLGSSATRRPDVRVPRRELGLDLANLSDRGHSPLLPGKLPRTVLQSLPLLLGATMATIRLQGPSSASRCWPCPLCYRHQFTGPPGRRLPVKQRVVGALMLVHGAGFTSDGNDRVEVRGEEKSLT
jgi:hypothetical protein